MEWRYFCIVFVMMMGLAFAGNALAQESQQQQLLQQQLQQKLDQQLKEREQSQSGFQQAQRLRETFGGTRDLENQLDALGRQRLAEARQTMTVFGGTLDAHYNGNGGCPFDCGFFDVQDLPTIMGQIRLYSERCEVLPHNADLRLGEVYSFLNDLEKIGIKRAHDAIVLDQGDEFDRRKLQQAFCNIWKPSIQKIDAIGPLHTPTTE